MYRIPYAYRVPIPYRTDTVPYRTVPYRTVPRTEMYRPLQFLLSSSFLRGSTSKTARALRDCVFQSSRVRWLHVGPSCLQQGVQVAVIEDGRKLELQCEGEQEMKFHGVWLRHNCRCPVCHSNETNMSRVNPNQLEGVEITSARVEGM